MTPGIHERLDPALRPLAADERGEVKTDERRHHLNLAIAARESNFTNAREWLTPTRFAILLGLFIAATFPTVLLGTRTFNIRDYGMFSYPVAFFHRESFWRGELPLWNPFNHCGVPFLAQWNTLTLYPLSLIYLVLPLPWSLSFFCLAHLFWGGLGMFFLARRWTDHPMAAAVAGLVFAFNGLSLNFLMWPSHIATFSWLPWVLWLGQAAWRDGGRKILWATLAGALQMLAGGPETIVLTWLVLLLLAVGDWVQTGRTRSQILLRFLGLAVLVGMICAAQLLPFMELLAHSQRDSGYSASTHDWAIPPWGWANFLVPLFRTSPNAQGVFLQNLQYWTSSYYAGIGTVLLAAVAMRRVRDWRVGLLATLCFLGLVLAWGNTSVLYTALRVCFPPLGFVRYPVKFVILVLALAPLLAAFGFQALTRHIQKLRRFEWGCALAALLLIGAIVRVDWNGGLPDDVHRALWRNGAMRATFFIITLLLLALFLKASRNQVARRSLALPGTRFKLAHIWNSALRQPAVSGCLLLAAFWLDLATQVPSQNPTVAPAVYASPLAGGRRGENLPPNLGQSRAMVSGVARDILSQNSLTSGEENYLRNRLAGRADCNLLEQLPVVDGFFSLTPREAAQVTGLPYGQTRRDSPALLDFLGVSQTTTPGTLTGWTSRPSAMPLLTAGQQPKFADDQSAFSALAQTNLDFREVVFLPLEARGAITATRDATARVTSSQSAYQELSLQTEAAAPSLVVLAQTYYPAWHARIDGQPTKLWRANYAFQALQVPAGKHSVQLVYQDRTFLVGVMLSGLGLVACFGLWVASARAKPITSTPDFACGD